MLKNLLVAFVMKGSQYYKQTKKFESFSSIQDCLDSGGRLPR